MKSQLSYLNKRKDGSRNNLSSQNLSTNMMSTMNNLDLKNYASNPSNSDKHRESYREEQTASSKESTVEN